MRMAGPDIVLLVVGALLFGGATYAIAKQPGGLTGTTSAAGVFTVSFPLATEEIASANVGSFRSGSVAFDVTQENVTRLTFDVACADPAGAAVPFLLQIAVTPPAGIPAPEPASGRCGSAITIEVPIAEAPADASVPGTTETEAREGLAPLPNATRAVGSWSVDYSGARQAGPAPLPATAGDPSGSIRLAAETWTPRFAPVQR